jgi:hypothetical protein
MDGSVRCKKHFSIDKQKLDFYPIQSLVFSIIIRKPVDRVCVMECSAAHDV